MVSPKQRRHPRIDGRGRNQRDALQIAVAFRLPTSTSKTSGTFSSSQWKSGMRPLRNSGRKRRAAGEEHDAVADAVQRVEPFVERGTGPDETAVSVRRSRGRASSSAKERCGEIPDGVLHHPQLVLEEAAIDEGEFDRLVQALARLGERPIADNA